jgi:hypothetical protein
MIFLTNGMDTYLQSLSNMQNGDKKYPHIYTKIQSTIENSIHLQANDISSSTSIISSRLKIVLCHKQNPLVQNDKIGTISKSLS